VWVEPEVELPSAELNEQIRNAELQKVPTFTIKDTGLKEG